MRRFLCLSLRVQDYRKREYGVQVEEIALWAKTIAKAVGISISIAS